METATNPKTGEKVILIDGQWVPVKGTATDPKGRKAYLVNDKWIVDEGVQDEVPKTVPEKKKEKVIPSSAEPTMLADAMDKASRFALGTAEPLIAVEQGVANSKPMIQHPLIAAAQVLAERMSPGFKGQLNKNIADLDKAKKQQMKDAGNEGFDVAGLLGNIFSPVSLATNKGMPNPASFKGKVAQGTAAGAAYGTAQTVKDGDYDTEKLSQVGAGAAIGALLPGGVEIAKGASNVVKKLLQPLSEAGRAKILKDYLDGLVGPAKEKVIAALRQAEESVPGSKPTVGEAVAEVPEATGLAAYQQMLAKVPGSNKPISAQFAAREAAQEGARQSAIGTVAKTKEALEEAVGKRTADAMHNYGAAYDKAIKVDPVLAQMSADPYFKAAMPDAMRLASSKGVDAKTDLTQFLHYVKISLDKMLTKQGDSALASTEKEAVKSVRDNLVKWVGQKNPLYDQARQEFSKASVPINQMQVGQLLQDKLTSSIGKERAGVFAEAVRNAPNTIKKSSGQTMYDDLGQVLTKEQKSTVDGILKDLQREAKYKELASKTSLAGGKNISEGELHTPQLLSREVALTNYVLKLFRHGADDKIQETAADLMLKPTKMADFLESVEKVSPGKVDTVKQLMLQKVSPEMREKMAKLFTSNPRILAIGAVSSAATDE